MNARTIQSSLLQANHCSLGQCERMHASVGHTMCILQNAINGSIGFVPVSQCNHRKTFLGSVEIADRILPIHTPHSFFLIIINHHPSDLQE